MLPAVETRAADSPAAIENSKTETLQQRRGRGGRWDNDRGRGRSRTFLQTRTVRRGRFMYRETHRVTTRNGRVISNQLVSRTRLSRV